MGRFTDSPYEYMMTEQPSSGQARETRTAPVLSDKCQGCPYGRARPCVGFCLKDLMADIGKKRRSHETDT